MSLFLIFIIEAVSNNCTVDRLPAAVACLWFLSTTTKSNIICFIYLNNLILIFIYMYLKKQPLIRSLIINVYYMVEISHM